MSAVETRVAPAATERAARDERRVPRSGWLIVAGKELADHLLSVRFIVLIVLLGLAAIVPLYFASDQIRSLASEVSGAQAVFIALFTISPQDVPLLRVEALVAIVAPLIGIAFSFDAINGERADGTLPRLLSQPIHRDDVVNGKFAAGLVVIALVLVAVMAVVAGVGIVRLGLVPTGTEIIRLIAWIGATIVYVAFWLAFGLLLSVAVRRAATSALIGLGTWVLLAVFGGFIIGLIAGLVAPITGRTNEEILAAAQAQGFIQRLLPGTLYGDVSLAILHPSVTQVSSPGTIGQVVQAQQQIPSLLSLDQSLLLVWPQMVALVALTVVAFAGAYILFMRQEVRA